MPDRMSTNSVLRNGYSKSLLLRVLMLGSVRLRALSLPGCLQKKGLGPSRPGQLAWLAANF